jgi:hypothetical protein
MTFWRPNPRSLLDGLAIRDPNALRSTSGSRPAIGRPLRTSYSRFTRPPDGLAGRVVAIYRNEGISDTRGCDKRPGLDSLLKGRGSAGLRLIAGWSVGRLT